MKPWHIRPLEERDHPAAVELLALLNPEIPTPVVAERFERILDEHPHYQAFGGFAGDEMVALAGAWVATKVWCGRYLEIDNIVVSPDHRSGGYGSRMIQHLEALAKEELCEIIVLDSYTSNHASHRLYHRLGFEIFGFHFVKSVPQTP
ncbi:hypothetical protein HAHE_41450 [Haloferula helveola]|uniref:N-acetyltransferase domain-containing protein n=1 Tax=Haloferula helveola TaxID=490095 RepID=A0ABN6HBW9_9BACT|nr:hypothetical protein HAHE_41450 [Haloferula helveola]